MARVILPGFLVLLIAFVYLLFWPVGLVPVAFQPIPPTALVGAWASDGRLSEVEVVSTPGLHGPEDVAVDPQGRVFVGVAEGKILRWEADGSGPTEVADTGGRPLGLAWARDGRLLIADGIKGLLALDVDGTLEVLLTEVDGLPLRFADDVDVASDGMVYLTDASLRWAQPDWQREIMEAGPSGRLVSWNPETGEARTVADGLCFPNGVAVAQDGRSVLVNETSRHRISRVFVKGPTKGSVTPFARGLPGYPDGIARGDGVYWVALASPREPMLDLLGPLPNLRSAVVRLPGFLQPRGSEHSRIVAFDEEGRVVEVHDDTEAVFPLVTSVEPVQGVLYLGSLTAPGFARFSPGG